MNALQRKILAIMLVEEKISSIDIIYKLEAQEETASIHKVHYELAELFHKKYVSFYEVEEPQRMRRYYSITEAGRGALNELDI